MKRMNAALLLPAMNAGQIERLWEIKREVFDAMKRLKQKAGGAVDTGLWDFEDCAYLVSLDAMFAEVVIDESCRRDIWGLPEYKRLYILKARRAQLYNYFLLERDGVKPPPLTDADINEAERLWHISASTTWLAPNHNAPECRADDGEDLF
jgi:hypothetical protein